MGKGVVATSRGKPSNKINRDNQLTTKNMNIRKNIAISETGFIFNPLTGDSFSVNPTGLFILRKLKEGATIEAITQALNSEYDLEAFIAERDLDDFLTMLKNHQITQSNE